MVNATYRQPAKDAVRRRLLSHAVSRLTTDREVTALLRPREFECTLEYACKYLVDSGVPCPWMHELRGVADDFLRLLHANVGARSADQLRILYLSGPEPSNDLETLLSLGCRQELIWAVEKATPEYEAGLADLRQKGLFVHTHHGSLNSFFEQVRERFDIVYIDACSALPGGNPNSLLPVCTMFGEERLDDLSMLVTTFTQYPQEQAAEYSALISYFYSTRYNELPETLLRECDPACAHLDKRYLIPFVGRNLELAYGDFVSRFLVDLGRGLLPLARVGANPDLMRHFFAGQNEAESIVENRVSFGSLQKDGETPEAYVGRWLREIGDVHLAATSYPLLAFLERAASDPNIAKLVAPLLELPVRGKHLRDALRPAAILTQMFEGNWNLASEAMREACSTEWFDGRGRYFCDRPFPSLLVWSLFGAYAHPYFYNPAQSLRLRYTAKTRTMYADAIALDKCRYYFDSVPSMEFVRDRFRSIPFQLVLRVALDRIAFHDWCSDSRPFTGCALGGFGEHRCATSIDMGPRDLVDDVSGSS